MNEMIINSKTEAEQAKKTLESKIAELEEELQFTEQQRSNYRQKLINEGYHNFEALTARQYDEGGINTPVRRKAECEHALARAKAELQEVEEALGRFAKLDINKRHKPLKNGCLGHRKRIEAGSRLLNEITGTLLEAPGDGVYGQTVQYAMLVDYQICTLIDGILCIDDPQSRYDGMTVMDYNKFIVPAYNKELNRRRKEALEKVEAARLQRELKELQSGSSRRGTASREIEEEEVPMLRKGQLPPWPEGVKNFKRK